MKSSGARRAPQLSLALLEDEDEMEEEEKSLLLFDEISRQDGNTNIDDREDDDENKDNGDDIMVEGKAEVHFDHSCDLGQRTAVSLSLALSPSSSPLTPASQIKLKGNAPILLADAGNRASDTAIETPGRPGVDGLIPADSPYAKVLNRNQLSLFEPNLASSKVLANEFLAPTKPPPPPLTGLQMSLNQIRRTMPPPPSPSHLPPPPSEIVIAPSSSIVKSILTERLPSEFYYSSEQSSPSDEISFGASMEDKEEEMEMEEEKGFQFEISRQIDSDVDFEEEDKRKEGEEGEAHGEGEKGGSADSLDDFSTR